MRRFSVGEFERLFEGNAEEVSFSTGAPLRNQMRLAAIAIMIVILNTEAASTATRLAAARIINKDRRS